MKNFTITFTKLRALLFAAVAAAAALCLVGCVEDVTEEEGGAYGYVKLGGLKWMKKNLNVEVGESWCYDDDSSNCNTYGRLYTWESAKAACRSVGWRLPTRADWDALAAAVGGKQYSVEWHEWLYAGKALKSRSGWDNNGNGTDAFGFSALPGGLRDPEDGRFVIDGICGIWWTATEYSGETAYNRSMDYDDDYVHENYGIKSAALSARCVSD